MTVTSDLSPIMAAASAAAEVQNLLRFMTQDAKVPLATALTKVNALRKHGLNTPDAIAKAESGALQAIFLDDKLVKQVNNAAKKVSNPKKRVATQDTSQNNAAVKRNKNESRSHVEIEADLALPSIEATAEELQDIEIETNRAPLFLAFTVVVLEYTMPEQPLSSRLSLAQAVVSANAQSKAKSIGLAPGATAEDEGWSRGQPTVKILMREIAVMRRQYTVPIKPEDRPTSIKIEDSQDAIKVEDNDTQPDETSTHEAFWGLDLDALRKSNGPLVAGKLAGSQGPPIYDPHSARSYLLRSLTTHERKVKQDPDDNQKKKRTPAEITAAKERATAMTLRAIHLLCQSWASQLSKMELDKRAWSWYVSVRPEVAQGQAGWGQRGKIRLADILKLRRDA